MNTTTDEKKINGIPVSAPGWRGTPVKVLEKIINDLSAASYHYAAEQPSETGLARVRVRNAANAVAVFDLGYWGARNLHSHTSQLVSFDEFVEAVMNAYYSKGHEDAR